MKSMPYLFDAISVLSTILLSLPPTLKSLTICPRITLQSQIIDFPETLVDLRLNLQLSSWLPLSLLPPCLNYLKLRLSIQDWTIVLDPTSFWRCLPKQLEYLKINDMGLLHHLSIDILPKTLKTFKFNMTETISYVPKNVEFFKALPNLETLSLVHCNVLVPDHLKIESSGALPKNYKHISVDGSCPKNALQNLPNSVTSAKFRQTPMNFDASMPLPPNLRYLGLFRVERPISLAFPRYLTSLEMTHSLFDDEVTTLPAGLTFLSVPCNGFPSDIGLKLLPKGLKKLHLQAISGQLMVEDRFFFYDPETALDLPCELEELVIKDNGRMFGEVFLKWWANMPRNLPLKIFDVHSNSECRNASMVPYLHPTLERIHLVVDTVELEWMRRFLALTPRRIASLTVLALLPVFYKIEPRDFESLPKGIHDLSIPTTEEHELRPFLDKMGFRF